MAITKKPQPKPGAPFGGQMAVALQKFIEAAPDGAKATPVASDSVQITLRVGRDELARYDQVAKRLGITRAAFIKWSVMQQLEAAPIRFLRQERDEVNAGEASLQLRLHVMKALKAHLSRLRVTQVQAAELCGVSQPRISDLLRGKANLFSLDALVDMAGAAGVHVDMRVMVEV